MISENPIVDFFDYHFNSLEYSKESIDFFLKTKEEEIEKVNAIINETVFDSEDFYDFLLNKMPSDENDLVKDTNFLFWTFQYIENFVTTNLNLDLNELFVKQNEDGGYYFDFPHIKDKEEIKNYIIKKIQFLIDNGDMFKMNDINTLFDTGFWKFFIENVKPL